MKFREYLEMGELNEGKKTPACEYVLQKMDSEEDGQDKYSEYVKQAVEKYKVDRKKLEKELDQYI